MSRAKAVFLDRDGTINKKSAEGDYIKSWDEFEFIPGAEEAMKRLQDKGFKLIVITNQSQIAHGIVTQETVDNINSNMEKALLEKGVTVDGLYLCPHHPDENCDCRKPKAGMLKQAARDFDVELASSYVVGDAAKDIKMGEAVGCKTVFVKTGEHGDHKSLILETGEIKDTKNNILVRPDKIVDNIVEAADWIVSQ